jgi:HK97 family phage prohead protease
MNTLGFDIEVKDLTDTGTFTGYAAVFNNVDQGGDRILPGAFAETLGRKSSVPLLWSHNPDQLIGTAGNLSEDRRGLKFTGEFVLEVPQAVSTYALMKKGAVRGISIGYRAVKSAREGDVRVLQVLDLIECSLTAFPMNEKAVVTEVKTESKLETALIEFARALRDGNPMPIKQFEDILREAGVPKSMATQIASVGYAKTIRSESEGKANADALAMLKEAAGAFSQKT